MRIHNIGWGHVQSGVTRPQPTRKIEKTHNTDSSGSRKQKPTPRKINTANRKKRWLDISL